MFIEKIELKRRLSQAKIKKCADVLASLMKKIQNIKHYIYLSAMDTFTNKT